MDEKPAGHPPYRTLSHSSDFALPLIAIAGKYKLYVGCSIVGIESVVLFGFDVVYLIWLSCVAKSAKKVSVLVWLGPGKWDRYAWFSFCDAGWLNGFLIFCFSNTG
jgi:hypothetical protein